MGGFKSLFPFILTLKKIKIKHVTIGCFETINKTKDHPSLGFVISPIQQDTISFLDGENWEVRRYLPFFMPLYLYTMATARPFAYNPGSLIPGTEQVGDLSIGAPISGFTDTPQYWKGPDEELGYVIAAPVSGNTQPTPLFGITASVGFYRTDSFDDNQFIELSEIVANLYETPQTFSTAKGVTLGDSSNISNR